MHGGGGGDGGGVDGDGDGVGGVVGGGVGGGSGGSGGVGVVAGRVCAVRNVSEASPVICTMMTLSTAFLPEPYFHRKSRRSFEWGSIKKLRSIVMAEADVMAQNGAYRH